MKTPVSYLLLLSLSTALLSPIQVSRAEESASAPPSESQSSVLVEQDDPSDPPVAESSSVSTTEESTKSESEPVKTLTQESGESLKPLITQNPGVKAGLTPVATAAELKAALENGESVQLTADITLNVLESLLARIQIGKNNPQDITIDGTDPTTGQHHLLNIADIAVLAPTTQLYIGSTGMQKKTIKFTNLRINNNNYYGLCHPTNESYASGSTLLFENVEYNSSAQSLHFMQGVIAFSGNNTITQTAGTWSQEFAETGRLDFRGGTTTINHAGGGSYGLIRVDQNPTDGIAPGIQVSGGAKVAITTNNAIFPASGSIAQIDIASKGNGSDLTLNAGGHIFGVTGSSSSKAVASDGGTINVTKANNFYQTGTTNRTIAATNNGHVNLKLSGSLYYYAQSQSPMSATEDSTIDIQSTTNLFTSYLQKSPITADKNSSIKLASNSDVFGAYVQDSPISATNNSEVNLNAGKDIFAYIYNPSSGNPIMQMTTDATSKMNLIAKDAFIRNIQANGLKLDIGGQLSATFGQYLAISATRPVMHDFRDNSIVDLTINGAQSVANGLIPLANANSYMKIGDDSQVTINNQTTTNQSVLFGLSGSNSPVTIGDSDVTINNNAVAATRLLENIKLNLENTTGQSPHTIYRGVSLTEKDQTKTTYPFVHFDSTIGTTNTTNSSDTTFKTKFESLTTTQNIAQLHLHDPLPPEIITLVNPGGLPTDDAQKFNFDLNGTATPASELSLNFLSAAGQSLLKGPVKTAGANQAFDYQFETDLPTQPSQIVVEANYPAPYALSTPVRKVLKDIPAGKLSFLAAPTHLDFGNLPLTNSQSPLYPYTKTADTSLIVSDPRATNRGDWAVQVNLKQPFTAGQATLDNALIWRKDQTTKPLVAGQPQQLYLKAAHAPIQPGADETDLTDLLQETVQAQFPAGPKQTTTPYTAELELMLITAPN